MGRTNQGTKQNGKRETGTNQDGKRETGTKQDGKREMGTREPVKYRTWPVIRRLMRHMREQEPAQLVRVAGYTAAAAAYPFLAVLLPKLAIGILEEGGADAGRRLILAMAVYFAAAAVLGYAMNRILYVIEICNMRIRALYLGRIGAKLTGMDYRYVEDSAFWEENDRAMNSCANNTDGMEGMYNRLYRMPANILTILGMAVLAGGLNPWILFMLVAHVLVLMWASRKNHSYRYGRKEERAKDERRIRYYHSTTHDFSFGKDIRIYNFRERILMNYEEEIRSLEGLVKRLARHEYLLALAGIATLLATNILMYGILIRETLQGMPISSFTMYVSLITSLMAAMITFGDDITFLQNEGQYVGDAFRLMDEQLADVGKEEVTVEEPPEIVFEHVDFRYPGSSEYVFKDLNFTIHRGERLAIVGVNGAGKSTLVKLMTGLFEPTAGQIYINGTGIEHFRKQDIYRIYSAVFQDVNVLAFPIRENVTGGAEDADDARVMEVLDKVGLGDKVRGFENGLDQMMLKVIDEDGTDFSGGERQKLSIARGLYKDAPAVIMDEPTAALDALAEAEIYERFSGMVEGKTAVYISHRLASTKFCDKIALFDKSGLCEYGSHEELMEKKGVYYNMFMVQGKYYQEEAV